MLKCQRTLLSLINASLNESFIVKGSAWGNIFNILYKSRRKKYYIKIIALATIKTNTITKT